MTSNKPEGKKAKQVSLEQSREEVTRQLIMAVDYAKEREIKQKYEGGMLVLMQYLTERMAKQNFKFLVLLLQYCKCCIVHHAIIYSNSHGIGKDEQLLIEINNER